MSRIGKVPVAVPAGVTVDLKPGSIQVKGAKGTLSANLHPEVTVTLEEGKLLVKPANAGRTARAMWGMTRSVVRNLVEGASVGYKKRLEVQGVGFRVSVAGDILSLSLGFSHEIRYAIPEGVKITSDKPTSLEITGADKQKVGQVAAEIRAMKKPEPYKGKGVRYEGEFVRTKEGKKK